MFSPQSGFDLATQFGGQGAAGDQLGVQEREAEAKDGGNWGGGVSGEAPGGGGGGRGFGGGAEGGFGMRNLGMSGLLWSEVDSRQLVGSTC